MAAMKLSFPSIITTTNASHFHLLTPNPLTLCFPLSPKPRISQTLTTHKNHLKSQTRPYLSPSAMSSTGYLEEVLPPVLDSTSDPPPIFDGTTRLYISITCPYAQRVWIARNCKGLQDQIQLVPIDLKNRPAWFKEMVYPANKVFHFYTFSFSSNSK